MEDRATARGRAMREAREAAGLDRCEAATRLNRALGLGDIIGPTLLAVWESGTADPPDADTFIEVIRMAGSAAAAIFASLS